MARALLRQIPPLVMMNQHDVVVVCVCGHVLTCMPGFGSLALQPCCLLSTLVMMTKA